MYQEERAYADEPIRVGGQLSLSSQEKAIVELHDIIERLEC